MRSFSRNFTVGKCPACGRQMVRGKIEEHHDHFAHRLRGIWIEVCRREGVPTVCARRHESRVVLQNATARVKGTDKAVAADAFEKFMRFATPIRICTDCNRVDNFMKGCAKKGLPRIPELASRAKFSATTSEIWACVIDSDGVYQGYDNAVAVQKYRSIAMSDPWQWRVRSARLLMRPLAHDLHTGGPCRGCQHSASWSPSSSSSLKPK